MFKIICKILIGIMVSMYLFPFGLTFLPSNINTKMLVAVLGAFLYLLSAVSRKGVSISLGLMGATTIAGLFSLLCYFSADYNETSDYAYATYFVSFFVWLGGAYAVCTVIKAYHKESNLRILTYYLASVCAVQCILALLIDNLPIAQVIINAYIEQGQGFLEEVGRLYGIGAALDPAGVRFAVVLILIAAVITYDEQVRNNRWIIVQLMLCYFIIIVVGNMISRTTTIGTGLSLFLFIIGTQLIGFVLRGRFFKIYGIFIIMLSIAIVVSIFLYQTNKDFHENLRYGFEGFFNWMETGVWRTDSTDKLNSQMWIWPSDTKTWIIGSGLFDGFVYGTDIGYCRFILYCGVFGLSVLAMLQIYNGLYFYSQSRRYRLLFVVLIASSFIIWIKVATDIFQFYALFYCLDSIASKDEVNDIEVRPALT